MELPRASLAVGSGLWSCLLGFRWGYFTPRTATATCAREALQLVTSGFFLILGVTQRSALLQRVLQAPWRLRCELRPALTEVRGVLVVTTGVGGDWEYVGACFQKVTSEDYQRFVYEISSVGWCRNTIVLVISQTARWSN